MCIMNSPVSRGKAFTVQSVAMSRAKPAKNLREAHAQADKIDCRRLLAIRAQSACIFFSHLAATAVARGCKSRTPAQGANQHREENAHSTAKYLRQRHPSLVKSAERAWLRQGRRKACLATTTRTMETCMLSNDSSESENISETHSRQEAPITFHLSSNLAEHKILLEHPAETTQPPFTPREKEEAGAICRHHAAASGEKVRCISAIFRTTRVSCSQAIMCQSAASGSEAPGVALLRKYL